MKKRAFIYTSLFFFIGLSLNSTLPKHLNLDACHQESSVQKTQSPQHFHHNHRDCSLCHLRSQDHHRLALSTVRIVTPDLDSYRFDQTRYKSADLGLLENPSTRSPPHKKLT